MRTVEKLGQLADQMVFVGGCAAGLLITDKASPPIRVTKDVDVIVDVASLLDYYRLTEKLRALGFREDSSAGAPVCRWVADDIILDVMPTDERILGFSNQWYRSAMQYPMRYILPNDASIHLVSAPYFLATKLDAFAGRGNDDYLLSQDIEDMIAVIDGRPEIVDEVRAAEPDLQQLLVQRFQLLLRDIRFVEAVAGHLQGGDVNRSRTTVVLETMRKMTSDGAVK